MIPSLETDARPPLQDDSKLVVLAGAIKWWWLSQCNACGEIGDRAHGFAEEYCPAGEYFDDKHLLTDFFGSARHDRYVRWRNDVRAALIDTHRYLTYAPHEAFKGTWTDAAQVVNDAAIKVAHAVVVLSPHDVITDGTDDEVALAAKVGTPVIYAPPGTEVEHLIYGLDELAAT